MILLRRAMNGSLRRRKYIWNCPKLPRLTVTGSLREATIVAFKKNSAASQLNDILPLIFYKKYFFQFFSCFHGHFVLWVTRPESGADPFGTHPSHWIFKESWLVKNWGIILWLTGSLREAMIVAFKKNSAASQLISRQPIIVGRHTTPRWKECDKYFLYILV